jgi:hypothetical protein
MQTPRGVARVGDAARREDRAREDGWMRDVRP